MLRISCDGDDIGAEVLVNGKFRGECPLDLQVPEGSLKLLVRKKVDGGRERVFEQDIRMGEGSVKKVEARLGAAKLNADEAARRAENDRRLRAMPLAALQKEAEAGNTEANFMLAKDYLNGTNGAIKNEELAVAWFKKAAEADHVFAMRYLWAIFAERNEMASSMIWLRKAAEGGHDGAMLDLAKRYEDGDGLPKSDSEALRWYRRAAEQGNADGMTVVGNFYFNGRGVHESSEEGVAWWRKAADAGHKSAMLALGYCYAKGVGVATSEEQAINWWRKAAEGKNPNKEAVEELKKRGLL
jgi:TPR repeat protein